MLSIAAHTHHTSESSLLRGQQVGGSRGYQPQERLRVTRAASRRFANLLDALMRSGGSPPPHYEFRRTATVREVVGVQVRGGERLPRLELAGEGKPTSSARCTSSTF